MFSGLTDRDLPSRESDQPIVLCLRFDWLVFFQMARFQ